MRELPTIADSIYRETFRHPRFKRMRDIITMPKFLLAPDVYKLIATIAYNDMSEDATASLRKMARLPFPKVWIEYDSETIELFGEILKDESDKVTCIRGWLVEQHPSSVNVIRSTAFIKNARKGAENEAPMTSPVSYVWSVSDEVKPEWPDARIISEYIGGNLVANEWSPFYGDFTQFMIDVLELTEVVKSDVLQMFALLATVDELPVMSKDVRPSKGFFAKGKYRQFLEHRTITLTIPVAKATKRLSTHLIEISRRKRHPVRGHWRKLMHASVQCLETTHTIGSSNDTHNWFVDNNHRLCLNCGSEGSWIPDHERGDATLGYVTHDYQVRAGRKR